MKTRSTSLLRSPPCSSPCTPGVALGPSPPIDVVAPCGSSRRVVTTPTSCGSQENVGTVVGSSMSPYFNQLVAPADWRPTIGGLASESAELRGDDLRFDPRVTDDAKPRRIRWRRQYLLAVARQLARARRVDAVVVRPRHEWTYLHAIIGVYYVNWLGVRTNDVALTSSLNLSAAFTMIVPNICDDMHSCPVNVGDQWLRRTCR